MCRTPDASPTLTQGCYATRASESCSHGCNEFDDQGATSATAVLATRVRKLFQTPCCRHMTPIKFNLGPRGYLRCRRAKVVNDSVETRLGGDYGFDGCSQRHAKWPARAAPADEQQRWWHVATDDGADRTVGLQGAQAPWRLAATRSRRTYRAAGNGARRQSWCWPRWQPLRHPEGWPWRSAGRRRRRQRSERRAWRHPQAARAERSRRNRELVGWNWTEQTDLTNRSRASARLR